MIHPNQTEKEFDLFFESIGYCRVSDDIGSSPSFQNADYVHKEKKIVVELKVLFKEQFENGGVIESINASVFKPLSIDENGLGQYAFSLPEQSRKGKHDCISEPIRRTLKKANKQIRETRQFYFGDTHSTGYVVLAQTGLESLSPEITAEIVRRQMDKEFSCINGAVICTPHYQTRNPFTLGINPECISITNDLIPELRKQCMELADLWVEHLERGMFTCT